MQAATLTEGDDHIIYDPRRVPSAGGWLFDPDHYRGAGAAVEELRGRGSVLFLSLGAAQWVLRNYGRSGLPARLGLRDYFWTGLARTRPWREFRLLARLHDEHFPVPAPVAARVRRLGGQYSGALLTERLADVRPIAECLSEAPLPEATWRAIGALTGRLHARRVHHSDLNVTNVMLDGSGGLWLIDFDNAIEDAPAFVRAAGLRRFRRSFRKALRLRPVFHYDEQCWAWLMAGYREATA